MFFNVYLNFLEQGKLLFLSLMRSPANLQLIKEQSLSFLHNEQSFYSKNFGQRLAWLLSLPGHLSLPCLSLHGQSERPRASQVFFHQKNDSLTNKRNAFLVFSHCLFFLRESQMYLFLPKDYLGCAIYKIKI